MSSYVKTGPGAAVVWCIAVIVAAAGWLEAEERPARTVVLNPYAGVDWEKVEHHRAALHTHTLQSDGRHSVADVVAAYRQAGFTILSLTDRCSRKRNLGR